MFKKLLELKYYETYYFANIIQNIIRDPFPYIRNLDAFWGDGEYESFIVSFPKYSVFHQFIEFIIRSLLFEEVQDLDLEEQKELWEKFDFMPATERKSFQRTPIEEAFQYYKIAHESFIEYLKKINKVFKDADEDDIYDYYNDLALSGTLDELTERTTEEVFHIMFLNREILKNFNEHIAGIISSKGIEEFSPERRRLFKRDGVLKRSSIPEWVKHAIFHRDKGRCTLCNKDLSGIISLQNQDNYDHIVPLAKGGINDVTNLQLLCKQCNSRKKHHHSNTSEYYERWY